MKRNQSGEVMVIMMLVMLAVAWLGHGHMGMMGHGHADRYSSPAPQTEAAPASGAKGSADSQR